MTRHSITCPRSGGAPRDRQRLPARDTDLLLHQIDAGQHLRHGVLDLDPRVHFHEVVRAVRVEQHLDGPRADVADRGGAEDGGVPHAGAQLGRHGRTGRLFDQLLVPPLHRAVTLAEVDHRALRVAQDLELDMPRPREVLLDVHVAIAERGQRLGSGQLE